jgi:glycosyltransferase involved in cell wall biosynthesis
VDLRPDLLPVTVVVPAYQEATSIEASLRRLVATLDTTGREYRVLVVSDGSTDGTADLARGLGLPSVEVLEYSPNRGKGYALRLGLLTATHPLVAFIDGDLDLDPVVLPAFFDRIEAGEADVVVGSKVHPESQVSYPWSRRVASRMFRLATRLMIGLDLGDTQTGVKAMRREVVAPAISVCTARGFAFDLELLARLNDAGARVVEAPVVLNFEFTSKLGAASVWEALRDLRTVAGHRRGGGLTPPPPVDLR